MSRSRSKSIGSPPPHGMKKDSILGKSPSMVNNQDPPKL